MAKMIERLAIVILFEQYDLSQTNNSNGQVHTLDMT